MGPVPGVPERLHPGLRCMESLGLIEGMGSWPDYEEITWQITSRGMQLVKEVLEYEPDSERKPRRRFPA